MKKSAIFGISVMAVVWIILAVLILRTNGITLYNLLLLAMTAIIIFVPLWKKYFKKD